MRMFIKGDAWTPQRFWRFVFTNDTMHIARLLKEGYCETAPSATELARAKDGNVAGELGRVGDQFFQ